MYSILLECYDGDEKIYDSKEFSYKNYKPETVFYEPDADVTIEDTLYEMLNETFEIIEPGLMQ